MNWAHVHLTINHFPVVGVFGAIALLIYSLLRKSEEVKLVSFGLFVLLALITLAVFFTGQAAEDTVKKLPGVTEAYIGRHEEMAELALVLIGTLGIASLAGLLFLRESGAIPKWIVVIVLLLSLVTAAVVGLTANLGGQIRHTEVRSAEFGVRSHDA
jgi:uncharacterized membrane protein